MASKKLIKAADKIVAQIVESIGYYNEQEPPKVVENDEGVFVVWEAGPYEWTLNDGYGLFEELKGLGMPGNYEPKKFWSNPAGFETEPENDYSLAVYEA